MAEEKSPVNSVSRRTVLKGSTVGAGALAMSTSAGASGSGDGNEAPDDEYDDEKADEPEHEPPSEIVAQTADIIGQGPEGPVVAENGATIWRTSNEILMEFSMPTPTPGEYTYPSAPPEREGEWWTDEVGEIEAFTLWAFTFNNPEKCVEPHECGEEDIGDPAGGGAFGVTGFVSDGGPLTLNGFVSTDTETFVMDGESLGVPLERPMEAEVHLAVAPHGAFDPAMMPEILQTPASPPDIWWGALFDPPA